MLKKTSSETEFVSELLRDSKENGTKEIDIIDLYQLTEIPLERLNRIMCKLEKKGVVKPLIV